MMRDRLIGVILAILLALGGWWVAMNTEWVDKPSPRPARGEARDNPVYAFEQLLRKLGMQARHFEQLDGMPPEGARLLLLSNEWELVPERGQQLRAWVERGGHLVLAQGTDWDETSLKDWVPIAQVDTPRKVQALPTPRPRAASAAAAAAASDAVTFVRAEPEGAALRSVPPVFGADAQLKICGSLLWNTRLAPQAGNRPLDWVVVGHNGAQAIRLPVGRGTVTVLNVSSGYFMDTSPLRCEDPLLAAAAMRAEPGAVAWIYLNERREPLLPWLWHGGAIAVLILAVALTAALWRGAVRVGPLRAVPSRGRRSIAEQVRGLGAYLHRHGRDALLQAQQRALDEAASRRLPGYSRLKRGDRAQAVARATGLTAEALSASMAAKDCSRKALPHHLQLLESARRRLLAPSGASQDSQDERRSP